jgi:acetyl-CoA carboxylase carboxyl transferase subunit beta
MNWFDNKSGPKLARKRKQNQATKSEDGLWKKCTSCAEILDVVKLNEAMNVCPYCDHHYRLSAMDRLQQILDPDTFEEKLKDLASSDPLEFEDKAPYKDKLSKALTKTSRHDGTVFGIGKVNGQKVSIAVMDFSFMGGSMGVVAGEKIAAMMEEALLQKIPAICVSCSGGARMQEGILSLMQMGKTSATRARLSKAQIPYVSILSDPTTGGVAASFSLLGDVIFAEPRALIGFAGPRVIEQSIRQTLPEGFQRSEFLLEHGMIDGIVHRHNMKDKVSFFINMFHNN